MDVFHILLFFYSIYVNLNTILLMTVNSMTARGIREQKYLFKYLPTKVPPHS